MLLKQSTARNIDILMVDSSDHVTGKTGLTLTISAGKDGGALATITPTVTERTFGYYTLALTTSHTDTLGDYKLHISASGADPTDKVYMVVLDLPGATVTTVAAVTAISTGGITAGSIATDAIGAAEFAADAVTKIQTGLSTPTDIASAMGSVLRTGTAQAGAAGTITLDAGASAVDNLYRYSTVSIKSGTGAGQARTIAGYVGSTKVASVAAWAVVPDATSVYWITASPDVVARVTLTDTTTAYTGNTPQTGDNFTRIGALGAGLTALASAAGLTTLTGYVDTEVASLVVSAAAIKAKTDNLSSDPADASDLAALLATVQSTLATIAAYIDTEVGAIKTRTDLIPAAPAAVGDIPTTGAIADAVYDEIASGHTIAGSYGDKLGAHLKAVLKVVIGTGSTTTSVVLDPSTGIDGAAPSVTNDTYNGRALVITSGALSGQATNITDYVGSTGTLTVTALTGSLAAGVTAVIV